MALLVAIVHAGDRCRLGRAAQRVLFPHEIVHSTDIPYASLNENNPPIFVLSAAALRVEITDRYRRDM